MAIPNNPNWSDLTDILPYPDLGVEKPPTVAGIHTMSLGPIELSNSQGKLNTRYWLVSQEDDQVIIRGAL